MTAPVLAALGVALLLAAAAPCGSARPATGQVPHYDVVVAGATPGGIMAAVAAGRLHNLSVAVMAEGTHVGGMCAGGLGRTDTGNTKAIGGLALEFFTRNGAHYGMSTPQWTLEPHVAEALFETMMAEGGVTILYDKLVQSVSVTGTTVTQVSFTDGSAYSASVFVDATYEGDLAAAAGASYTVGREAATQYNESWNGRLAYSPKNQLDVRVNPWVDPSDPHSELLPHVLYGGDSGVAGQADKKVEAYNFRLCVTQNKSNMVPFPKPANYNASDWELARRYAAAVGSKLTLKSFLGNTAPVPNGKYDQNNGGGLSTDCIGCSWTYPEASHRERATIFQQHKDYHQGLLWFVGHDPFIPQSVRSELLTWGLCADEFLDTGGWPFQLYVREARRVVGDKVFTQHSATAAPGTFGDAVIGVGGYHEDSHNVQRFPCVGHSTGTTCVSPARGNASATDFVIDEGDIEINIPPFEIPYWAMLPKRSEVTNLVAPVPTSASHAGFCTLRLEPTWMVMGHATGTAAAIAIKHSPTPLVGGADGSDIVMQDVNTTVLHSLLKQEGAVLSANF